MPIIGNEEKNYAKYLAPAAAISKHLLYASSAVTPSLLHLGWFLVFWRINAPNCTCTQTSFFPSLFFFAVINWGKLNGRKIDQNLYSLLKSSLKSQPQNKLERKEHKASLINGGKCNICRSRLGDDSFGMISASPTSFLMVPSPSLPCDIQHTQ